MPVSMTCDWYLLTCLTHLHAGRGDTNYDIVDKEVQRDPLDELPVIHASSLKGALREWFREQLPGPLIDGKQKDSDMVNTLFGNDTKRGNSTELGQGTHQFFEGRLLALPVRCSHRPFLLATSKAVLTDHLTQLTQFGVPYAPAAAVAEALTQPAYNIIEGKPMALTRTLTGDGLMLDEYEARTAAPIDQLTSLLGLADGTEVALFHDQDLIELAKRLPVIARNNLENGRSVNLWYEEVVPRQARFSFFVRHPTHQTDFNETLSKHGGRVQIGANATIGYGQCTLAKVAGS